MQFQQEKVCATKSDGGDGGYFLAGGSVIVRITAVSISLSPVSDQYLIPLASDIISADMIKHTVHENKGKHNQS